MVLTAFPNKTDTDSHDITILLQACFVNFVTILLQQACVRVVRQPCKKSGIRRACYKLSVQGEHNLLPACR